MAGSIAAPSQTIAWGRRASAARAIPIEPGKSFGNATLAPSGKDPIVTIFPTLAIPPGDLGNRRNRRQVLLPRFRFELRCCPVEMDAPLRHGTWTRPPAFVSRSATFFPEARLKIAVGWAENTSGFEAWSDAATQCRVPVLHGGNHAGATSREP